MSFGNQYLYYDSSVGWQDGYLELDNQEAPSYITFSNNDFSSNPVFPLSSTYTGTISPPSFTVGLYTSSNGSFVMAARLSYNPSSSTTNTTTYPVLSHSRNVYVTMSPEESFALLFRFPEPGPTGPAGPVGPTGLVYKASSVALSASTGPQNVQNNSDTVVLFDTAIVPSTNTDDVVADLANNAIKCVEPGLYSVTGRLNWANELLASDYKLDLLLNGNPVYSVKGNSQVSGLVSVVSANSLVSLRVKQTSGSSQDLYNSVPLAPYLSASRFN